jgi:hypothetical protein
MRVLFAVAAAALTGCVSSPDTIKATSVSAVGYDQLTCPQLAAEDARVAGVLGPMTYYQQKRHNNQLAGAVLVGIPLAMAISEDHSQEIARLMGEMETIAAVKQTKACPEPATIVNEKRPIEDIKREAAQKVVSR